MAAYVNNKVISICVYFKVPKVCLQHGALLFLLCKINLKFNKTKQVERLIRSGLGRESFPGASLAEQPLLGYKPALQGNLVWGKEWQGTSAQPSIILPNWKQCKKCSMAKLHITVIMSLTCGPLQKNLTIYKMLQRPDPDQAHYMGDQVILLPPHI